MRKGLLFIIVTISVFSNTFIHADENLKTLTIEEAEDIGVKNSPEIVLIGSQQTIKKRLVKENWRNYFPIVSVRWDRNKSVIENSSDTRNQRLVLNLEQVVYDGGRRSLALKSALSDLALAKYDQLIALNDYRLKLRSLFYDILSQKAILNAIHKSLDRQKEQLTFAKKEVSLGENSSIQLLELENRYNEIVYQENNAKIELQNKLRDFKILLRIDFSENIDVKGDVIGTVGYKFANLSENEILPIALKSRVEIDRANAADLLANSDYKYAKTYFIPTISVGSYYGYNGETYPPRKPEWGVNFKISMLMGPNTLTDSANYSHLNNNDKNYSASTSLSIYDQLQYKRKIISTGIAAYKARLDKKYIISSVATDVKKALANYEVSWKAVKQADANIELFEKRIEITQLQVSLGEAKRTDLATTEIRYLEAKNAQIAARVRYMLSVAQLEIALGIGIDSFGLISL